MGDLISAVYGRIEIPWRSNDRAGEPSRTLKLGSAPPLWDESCTYSRFGGELAWLRVNRFCSDWLKM